MIINEIELVMDDIKFSLNIFASPKGRKQIGINLIKEKKERVCSTCRHYRGRLICKHFGKIKNPDCIYCSWWKDKEEVNKKLQTKKCGECEKSKHISEFYKDKKNGKNGCRDIFKNCLIKYQKKYYGKIKSRENMGI